MSSPFPAGQTWPEGATPNVDQLRAWVRSHPAMPDGQPDARIAAGVILKMLVTEQREHADTRRRVDALTDAMARYRLAWLSARARATSWTPAACGATSSSVVGACGRDKGHRGRHRSTGATFSASWEA